MAMLGLVGMGLAAQAAWAGFVVEPLLERNFGTIHYDLDFPFPPQEFSDTSGFPGGNAYGRSQLIYPVDVTLVGLRLETGEPDGLGRSIFASLKVGITQPQASMEDKDWFELRSSTGTSSTTAFVLFSDTESRSRLKWWSGDLGEEFPGFLYRGRRIRIGWRLGMDYYAADIFGIKGWQGNKVGGTLGVDYVEFDTLSDVKVLTYRAFYISPGAIASTHWLRGRKMDLDFRAGLSPLTLALDNDNHLLREKKSTSWALGLDGSFETDLVFHWGPTTQVKAGASIGYTRTWGLMTQEFYGNTPEAAQGNLQLKQLGSINNSLGRFIYGLKFSTPFTVSGGDRNEQPRKVEAP